MKRKIVHTLFIAGLVFYLGFIMWNILFKYVAPWELADADRFCSRTLNLIPFNDIIEGNYNRMDVWGNIILFMPLGIYLAIIFKEMKPAKIIGIGLAASFTFEALQYLLGIGASDITDLITNTLGTAVGLMICILIRKIIKDEERVKTFVTICSMVVMVPVVAIVTVLVMGN